MTAGKQYATSGEAATGASGESATEAVGAAGEAATGKAWGSGEEAADVAAVATLDEPTRRRIYDHVRGHAVPVSRDEVADGLGVPRRTAAFHLDRLAEQGLLAVSFARRTGRSGPGAGRPAKLYQRSAREVSVSLPPRHYDLAGRLLAGAVVEAQHSGEPPREVLDRRARDLGEALASNRHGEDNPRVLMDLLEGVLDGLGTTGLHACLDPGPSRCCVRLESG